MKMNIYKYLLACCILIISSQAFSQISINYKDNKNIGGAFHIDGKGDNDPVPTAAQTENDVFVNTDGKVGLGTVSPEVHLHIEPNAASTVLLRIADGSEGEGRVLTSGADGTASWQKFGAIPVVEIKMGTQMKATISQMAGKYLYTGTAVTLPPGLWLIEANVLGFNTWGGGPSFSSRVFIRTILADTNTGQSPTKDSYASGQSGRMAAGNIYLRGSGFNMINGYFIVNNNSAGNKTYYYMAGNCSAFGTYNQTTEILFGGDNESTMFAIYMDEARP